MSKKKKNAIQIVNKETLSEIILNAKSVSKKQNSKTGSNKLKIKQKDGCFLSLTQTKHGNQIATKVKAPAYNSKEERKQLAKDLKKEGMTQKDIAEILGFSQSTISNDLRE